MGREPVGAIRKARLPADKLPGYIGETGFRVKSVGRIFFTTEQRLKREARKLRRVGESANVAPLPLFAEAAMLRARLTDELKTAMKAKDQRAVSTLRLILAALKDRDIAARERGVTDGIGEGEIVEMLQKMVRQRRESIDLYEKGGRPELAQQEAEEIAVIERFLPKQLSEAEMEQAVAATMAEVGASSIKDMGKVMGALKSAYAGRMDFAKAGQLVKQKLG